MTEQEAIGIFEQVRQAFNASGKDADVIREAVTTLAQAYAARAAEEAPADEEEEEAA